MRYYSDTHKIDMIFLCAILVFLFAMICSAFLKNITLVIWCFGLILAALGIMALIIPIYCFVLRSLILKHGEEYIAIVTDIGKSEILYGPHIQESRVLHFDIRLRDRIISVVYAFIEDTQHNIGDNLRVLVYKDKFIFV